MSAFLHSDKHLATLAYYISRYCSTGYSVEQIGQILLDENIRSLVARYGESEEKENAHEIRIGGVEPELTPPVLLKMIDSYSYQACETDDWKTTEAYSLVTQLREKLIYMITDAVDHRYWALR